MSAAQEEHQKPFFPTVGTADAGKPAAWIATVQIAFYDLLYDGPEETLEETDSFFQRVNRS